MQIASCLPTKTSKIICKVSTWSNIKLPRKLSLLNSILTKVLGKILVSIGLIRKNKILVPCIITSILRPNSLCNTRQIITRNSQSK